MHRTHRRGDRGLTLIEILLSILVLVLGILGIMALFPTALQTSRVTIEQRHSVNVAESVKHSIGNAFRFQFATGTGEVAGSSPGVEDGKVIMTHDMDAGNAFPFLFLPPNLAGSTATAPGWRRHPAAAAVDMARGTGPLATSPVPNPEAAPQFYVSSDAWLNASVSYIRSNNDPTEPYRQYAFNFDIAKVNTLQHLLTQVNPATGVNWTPDELDPMIRLYECRIHVHRIKGGGGVSTGSGNGVNKNLILTVTHRVALK